MSLISLSIGLLAMIFSAILAYRLRLLKRQNEILFSGRDAKSLEQIIAQHSTAISEMDKDVQELFEISNQIHNLSFKGFHKLGIIRFNPFKDIGGNQSFAIAILDGKNSGMVISSLHTREAGTRLYAKPIVKGKSEEYQLTEEENKAIAAAIIQKGTKI